MGHVASCADAEQAPTPGEVANRGVFLTGQPAEPVID
jgi:hypothetical protein